MDDQTTPNGYDYVVYSVGGSYDIGMFTLDLNWTEAESGVGKAGTSEATEAVIFSVSAAGNSQSFLFSNPLLGAGFFMQL